MGSGESKMELAQAYFGSRVREDKRLGSYILDGRPTSALAIIKQWEDEGGTRPPPRPDAFLESEPRKPRGHNVSIENPTIQIGVKVTDSILLSLVNSGRMRGRDTHAPAHIKEALSMLMAETLGDLVKRFNKSQNPE